MDYTVRMDAAPNAFWSVSGCWTMDRAKALRMPYGAAVHLSQDFEGVVVVPYE